MIHTTAPNSQSKSKDSQSCSEVPIWFKWFASLLQSPDLNKKLCKSAPKFRSKPNDIHSELRSPNLNWQSVVQSSDLNQRFVNPHRSSDLNQMIHDLCSKVPIWIKRFVNPHRSSDLNQMFHDLCSKVPIWIKRFVNPHRSSDLNQMFHDLRFCSPDLKNDSQSIILGRDESVDRKLFS